MFVKEYYSEWLDELCWLLLSLCNAVHMYAGCPHADNHIIWKTHADEIIASIKKEMLEKKVSVNLKIFKMEMKEIKKLRSQLKKLELPWFLQDEMNFFNEFILSCKKEA